MQDRKRLIIKADGNCLFRAFSFLFFGSQDAHSRLRSLLVKFIALNNSCFSPLVFTGCINEHITSMKCLGKWGTQVELQAAASLAQVPVYVLTKGATEEAQYNWIMYKPHLNTQLTFPDESLHFLFDDVLGHLELCHTNGDHYDCIINVMDQCSTKPPVLQECHKYVSEVL